MAIPKPIGNQKDVLAFPSKGHFVVLGTAGSGKTTLAILRSAMLSRGENRGRTLLLTFNKALVVYLNTISDGELRNVDVRNYHTFARGYLGNKGLLGDYEIIPNDRKKLIIKKILEERKNLGVNAYQRGEDIFYEEILWLQRMGIQDLFEYENIVRVGRVDTRIIKEDRKYFFDVYLEYLKVRAEKGYKYDWEDIAFYVKEAFENDQTKRMYKHIVIDEGQDFSPVMLQSLVSALPPDGSITFFGDVAQQIYGSRLSWRTAGLLPKKVEVFKQNYRNTKAISDLALAISQSTYYQGEEDLIVPVAPRASGPLPGLVKFRDETSELKAVLNHATRSMDTQRIGILVRNREKVRLIVRELARKDVTAQTLSKDLSSWSEEPGISVGTFHSAKGLEFDSVYLPLCNDQLLPYEERVMILNNEEEAKKEDIKLLYVGVTRARRSLIITYTGDISPLIPEDMDLFQVANNE
jgi:superfamily I DNA/RNA helicase